MPFSDRLSWELSIIGLSLTAFTLANLMTKPKHHKTDLLLSIWLVFLNIPLLHTVLSGLNINAQPFRLLTNPTLNLLQGPILFLYVRMLINRDTNLQPKKELLHLVPFTVFYLIFISSTQSLPMMPSPDGLASSTGPAPNHFFLSTFAPLLRHFGLINALIFIGYSIAVVMLLLKHQKQIAEIFSQNDHHISLRWIYALPVTYLLLVFLNLANETLFTGLVQFNPLALHMLSFLCVIVLLGFFGVKQIPVFYSAKPIATLKEQAVPLITDDTLSSATSQAAPVAIDSTQPAPPDQTTTALIAQLQYHMKTEKPYQDPDFSVYALAEAVNVPRRTLSAALNSCLSKNFYQFVNEYRLEEVKHLLQQPAGQQAKIIDIAFQSGFKSKSSLTACLNNISG